MNNYTIVDNDTGDYIWSGEAKGLNDAIDKMISQPGWEDYQANLFPSFEPIPLEIRVCGTFVVTIDCLWGPLQYTKENL